MTASSDHDRERAETEAAAWLVELSESPGATELRARFEAWRTASPLNAGTWERTRRAYELVGRGPAMHEAHWRPYADAGGRDRRTPAVGATPAGRRRWPLRAVAAAAGMAVAACIAIAVVPGALLRLQADTVTATGEVRPLSLADGTRILLGPQSAIDAVVSEAGRHVRLLAGEAFLEVAPDPDRPFRVTAGGTEVVVLGTAFEVRRREAGADVAVQHGQVRVESGTATPALLQAGDRLQVDGRGARRGRIRADEVAAWRRGELIVRDRPIAEIVGALRPYFGGVIVMRDGAFASRRVSGVYSLKDPVTTLRELGASHGGAVTRLSPWLVVVGDG